jgi:hypothetical protein
MFRVVQRTSSKSTGRSSADDLAKVSSTVCYLIIGLHKVHLVPLQKSSNRTSVVSLNDLDTGMSFGIMTLASFSMHRLDDAFQMTFR